MDGGVRKGHQNLGPGLQGLEASLLRRGRCVFKTGQVCWPEQFTGGIQLQVRGVFSAVDFATVICTSCPGHFICGGSVQIMVNPGIRSLSKTVYVRESEGSFRDYR